MKENNKKRLSVSAKILFNFIFISLFFVAFVSGFNLTSTPSSFGDFSRPLQSKQVTIRTLDNNPADFQLLNNSILYISTNSGLAEFGVVNLTPLTNVTSATFSLTLNSISGTFPIGVYSSNLVIKASRDQVPIGESSETEISVPFNYVKSFCTNGPINDTDLILDVKVKNRGSGTEEKWYPLDKIDVDVKLTNNKNIDLDNIIFKIGLFKVGTNKNVIEDMMWISQDNEEFEVGSIDSGDSSQRYTFEFRVDPTEVEYDTRYYLVVKAYSDRKENALCIDKSSGLVEEGLSSSEYFGEITISSKDNRDEMVVIDDYDFLNNPIQVMCGEEKTFNLVIYNIGDSDFEDRIKVNVFNKELGINVDEVIYEDLDSGDKKIVPIKIRVPNNATEKIYPLYMTTHYSYQKSTDTYKYSSKENFLAYLDVKGGCVIPPNAVISYSFISEAISGQPLEINISILNKEEKGKFFVLEASDYESWADTTQKMTTLFVGGGAINSAVLKLDVNQGITGDQIFNLKVYSDGKLISTQQIKVNIRPTEGEGVTREIFENAGFPTILKENKSLLVLGILNIVIIILIIIVALRIGKK
ncbi:MAG: putative S-layer protein [Candidatus Pacearchaeota archaeon]